MDCCNQMGWNGRDLQLESAIEVERIHVEYNRPVATVIAKQRKLDSVY